MGDFTTYTSPSPPTSEDESDDGSSNDDPDEDDGASSPSDDEMSTWFTYPLSLMTKRGSSFDMRVVIYIRGELAIGDFCDRGSVYTVRDVVRFLCIFFSFFYIYLMYIGLLTIWHTLYLYLGLYILMYVIHLFLHVLFLLSLYAHDSYILYAIFYFYFTLRCLDEFCLKCFRNTSFQSLLTKNSLLAKFFKSLC